MPAGNLCSLSPFLSHPKAQPLQLLCLNYFLRLTEWKKIKLPDLVPKVTKAIKSIKITKTYLNEKA